MVPWPDGPDAVHVTPRWRKDRRRVRQGFKDLEYLPPGRSGWNATLATCAYSARRLISGAPDLNLWAAMHGCAPSARYVELGEDALVLWHGTSAVRAEKIREHGLFKRKGVWAAVEPRIAHGYARGRSQHPRAGSATIVLLVSRSAWDERADAVGASIVRFHESIPRECVEYILWDDRVEFVGARAAAGPKPWGVARFKRRQGRWVPRSRPPVRFDAEHRYDDLEGWLRLSIGRITGTLGRAAAIEIFASLYATIAPWDVLEHQVIFDAVEAMCGPPNQGRRGLRLFSLRQRN